jgi:hypothetical protein
MVTAIPACSIRAICSSITSANRGPSGMASARTAATPLAALDEAAAAESPTTLGRARAIEVRSLLLARRPADAEALARAEVRRRPEDAFAVRRLYEVQRLRGRSTAAAATLRRLRTLDPLFAAGLGG